MHRQRGVSLSGFIMWSVVMIFILLLALKIGPSYMEYLTLQKQLKAIVNDPSTRGGARRGVVDAFRNRALASDIKSITEQDLVITKEGNNYSLSAEYTVCVPVISNIRACMDFSPSSSK